MVDANTLRERAERVARILGASPSQLRLQELTEGSDAGLAWFTLLAHATILSGQPVVRQRGEHRKRGTNSVLLLPRYVRAVQRPPQLLLVLRLRQLQSA